MVKSQLHFGSKSQIIFNQKSERTKNAKSLETKQGAIKHYVNKFVGVYAYVVASMNQKSHKRTPLQKHLYCARIFFGFIHCWLILKDVPR
jgi:hypothetical protein